MIWSIFVVVIFLILTSLIIKYFIQFIKELKYFIKELKYLMITERDD